MDHASLNVTERRAVKRLTDLVAEADRATITTPGGVVKPKTTKQKQIDKAVAEEVVRFAFDHAGITGGNLAPTGLYLDLLAEVRAR